MLSKLKIVALLFGLAFLGGSAGAATNTVSDAGHGDDGGCMYGAYSAGV